ncbi:hypothetical protein KCV07_g4524, partial [Aureobasidium melanogenum]
MYPSEELGSPSLALSIEVPRSPSLPRGGTPLWDSMSLPSSPSPKVPVPDSNMDLDRWAERGFSEDLALPPRQIVKPLRFLDLPVEVRIMIYKLTFTKNVSNAVKLGAMHILRHKGASVNFPWLHFDWYWDPLSVSCGGGNRLKESLKFLAYILELAATNAVHIRSITVRSPRTCNRPEDNLENTVESVRFLAPLRKSLEQIGRVHLAVREFKFEDENSLARRVFDFAGSLSSFDLKSKKTIDQKLRLFLHKDRVGAGMIKLIMEMEEEARFWAREARWEKQKKARVENKAKGAERWNTVLRNRVAKGQT